MALAINIVEIYLYIAYREIRISHEALIETKLTSRYLPALLLSNL